MLSETNKFHHGGPLAAGGRGNFPLNPALEPLLYTLN